MMPASVYRLESAPRLASSASMGKSAAAVPCGDTTFRRVYVVDAQPGGSGATEWMFAHLDDVLATAVALAQTSQA
jgi:hypothetical protein